MIITPEAFAEWQAHPVTREIIDAIKSSKQTLMESFANGVTLSQSADITHGLTHKLVGQIEGLNQLLNITIDNDIKESENE